MVVWLCDSVLFTGVVVLMCVRDNRWQHTVTGTILPILFPPPSGENTTRGSWLRRFYNTKHKKKGCLRKNTQD